MITLKEVFEGMLKEVKKEQAPHLHLRDFNYYINKAVSDFIDSIDIAFETSQQTLDYLRPLKKTVLITSVDLLPGIYSDSVKFQLPDNYRSLKNIIVRYKVSASTNDGSAPIFDDCYETGDNIFYGSHRLDSDKYASIVNDPFQRPEYYQPRHIINGSECFILTGVHTGLDIEKIQMDYLKEHEKLILTQQQAFNKTEDTSQVLEFDDKSSRRIIEVLVQKILERNGDPRTSSHTQINQIQPPLDSTTGLRGGGQ